MKTCTTAEKEETACAEVAKKSSETKKGMERAKASPPNETEGARNGKGFANAWPSTGSSTPIIATEPVKDLGKMGGASTPRDYLKGI